MEKGSKLIIFLSVLLVIQIGLFIYLYSSNKSIDFETYCKEHGYNHGSDIVSVSGGSYED
jgi:hypothetical protein